MRFWPFRRRRVALPSADSTAFTVAELAPQLAGVLAVDQVRAEGHAVAFGGRPPVAPAPAAAALGRPLPAVRQTPVVPAGGEGPARGLGGGAAGLLDRPPLVEGGSGAGGGERRVRRLAPAALHDLAELRYAPAGTRRLRPPGGACRLGRALRHRAQPDPGRPARRRPDRLRALRSPAPADLDRDLRRSPGAWRRDRGRELVRLGLPAPVRHGLSSPAAARRPVAPFPGRLRRRRLVPAPADHPDSARPHSDTVVAALAPGREPR